MVNATQCSTRRGGVTFVHVVVENESTERRRVRLDVDCDGAVWPPRRRGVPEAGWDADGVTVTVAGGRTRGLGFATPAATASVALVDVEGRGGIAESDPLVESAGTDSVDVDGVVRALGSFAPPLAATPREKGDESRLDSNSGDGGGRRVE
ncbi:hypothetical protein G9C85_09100 [Halorubellus sp. JP-L1]|uniref:DUF7857 domain-containing protein n=1 Tax=Halorubellus sp. JP-L1 TaxID=2715753 RepID=UPI00140B8C53|nr:hypothetical protein [Halorubellus sp. JP-L1]NHN41786.1 hypothetical protein [Halorubellus sp. JP-L1]